MANSFRFNTANPTVPWAASVPTGSQRKAGLFDASCRDTALLLRTPGAPERALRKEQPDEDNFPVPSGVEIVFLARKKQKAAPMRLFCPVPRERLSRGLPNGRMRRFKVPSGAA